MKWILITKNCRIHFFSTFFYTSWDNLVNGTGRITNQEKNIFGYCFHSVIAFIQLLLSFCYCFHSVIVFILLLFSFGYCYDKWSGPSGAHHVFDLKIVWDYFITSSSYIHGTKENCIAGMKVLAWSHRTKSSLVGGLEVCRGSSAIW